MFVIMDANNTDYVNKSDLAESTIDEESAKINFSEWKYISLHISNNNCCIIGIIKDELPIQYYKMIDLSLEFWLFLYNNFYKEIWPAIEFLIKRNCFKYVNDPNMMALFLGQRK